MSRIAYLGFFLLVGLGAIQGCGAKTGVSEERVVSDLIDAGPPCQESCADSTFCAPSCIVDGECVPLRAPSCDDEDSCTADCCDPVLDQCVSDLSLDDLDHDGFEVPFQCGGTDCDDGDPAIHPGAREICNSIDDDCDGLVDEGADLVPVGSEIAVAASEQTDAAADLVWTGESYVLGFWDYRGGDADVYLLRLDQEGNRLGEEIQVTTSAGDGYGPSLVWNGSELGVTWNDRRDGNFEVYFARFDRELRRLTGDLRLTNDPSWSVYPEIAWSGREYLIVWQDDRSGLFEAYAQRVGPEGPAGPNTPLRRASAGHEAESPLVAFAGTSYQVVWLEGSLDHYEVRLTWFDQLLDQTGTRVLSSLAQGTAATPGVAAGNHAVAVSWEQEQAAGWRSVVSLLTPEGQPIAERVAIDLSHSNSREVALLWENSGFLLVWSTYEDLSFQLFFSVLDPSGELSMPTRELVRAPGDSVGSVLALGPGEVGVAWSDTRSGTYDAYFTRLLCAGL